MEGKLLKILLVAETQMNLKKDYEELLKLGLLYFLEIFPLKGFAL